ncbi:PfkB family carbohydrate kinase [Pseudactinotalea suaedae]|uniref:PfkB family carbohydrate kinase n=1 Tax=Pseudactinotalea suaedae TaxID=1524924 RepID=UPI0012E141BA|nr:PfkB family carbohydrate kinase [Pseudactinotalea suaedae]
MTGIGAPRVIHTAQALVDEVLEVPSLPPRGGNVVPTGRARYAASAVNVLLAAARSGAACVHAGSIGTGPNGDLIRSVLAEAGVSVSSPPVPDLDTGVCLVLLEPSAERTFITAQGAERQISVASLARSAPVPGDVVCVSGYTLVGPTRDPLLEWLESLPDGVAIVLDPGAPFADLDDGTLGRMLALCTVWTGNADEADGLARLASGAPSRSTAQEVLPIAESAAAVAGVLPESAVVVVRDGPAGCVVHRDGVTARHPGFAQRPVDTNGAGDTHTGVLVAEIARGTDWPTAATRANAAGAIKVTRRGPDTAPTAAEVDEFLAVHG